jgi:hypothetical protein
MNDERQAGWHIYAAFAEKERRLISLRTKEALARAQAKGVKLGGQRTQSLLTKQEALRRAQELRPIFQEIVGDGGMSANALSHITAFDQVGTQFSFLLPLSGSGQNFFTLTATGDELISRVAFTG